MKPCTMKERVLLFGSTGNLGQFVFWELIQQNFDVTVVDDLVDEVTLDAPFGSGYSVGDVLTLPGSSFGGTEDITITIDSI